MTQHSIPVRMKHIATEGPQCKSKNIQTDISQHLEASSHGKVLLGTPSGMQSCRFLSSRVIAKLVCELYFPPNIVTHTSCLFALSDITCSNLHHRLLHKHAVSDAHNPFCAFLQSHVQLNMEQFCTLNLVISNKTLFQMCAAICETLCFSAFRSVSSKYILKMLSHVLSRTIPNLKV